MKYNMTVTSTPTGKFHIVGSQVPEKLQGIYSDEMAAWQDLNDYLRSIIKQMHPSYPYGGQA